MGGSGVCDSEVRKREGEYGSNGKGDDAGLGFRGHEGVVQLDEEVELATMVLVLEGGQVVLVNRVLLGCAGGDDELEDSKCLLLANDTDQFVRLWVSGEINRTRTTLNGDIGVLSLPLKLRRLQNR